MHRRTIMKEIELPKLMVRCRRIPMASQAPENRLTHFLNAVVHIVPSPRRVRCIFAGETVADSTRVILVRAVGKRRALPLYYFPVEDVRMHLLNLGPKVEQDEHIGEIYYYDLAAGGREAKDAAWMYGEPRNSADGFGSHDAPDLRGYVAFAWNKLDAWFEEDEEVFVHARDPYKRVDCLPSSRHVKIVLGGEVVAETTRSVLLFETGLITRYYIPKLDVRQDMLRPSDKVTRCPYKG
ncbi:MAG: DUF427 domain-containing protein, partial [Dehalococcoidia bacterium]|nr:DUF427 domain-containing protein [Dehalococcoidia bacterium]